MYRRWQFTAVLVPLALVEVTSFWNLSNFLAWSSEPWLALTTGLAFVSLLLGAVVAMSLDIPKELRQHIFLAGVWLFLVQGTANCLVGYEFGLAALPTEVITGFFGIGPDVAHKATAIVQGASLSIVSINFWSVLALMLRSQWEEERGRRMQLANLEKLMEANSDETVRANR